MKDSCVVSISTILQTALLLVLLTLPAYGQGVTVQKDGTFKAGELALPYAFYNQSFGAAAGFVYGSSGWPQKQATLLGTVIAGTDNSLAVLGLARDVQVPFFTNRLFLDADFLMSWYGTMYSYTNGNPAFRGQQAGTNNSRDNDYVRGSGNDYIARVKFRYVLPIGDAKDDPISTYVVDQGLLVKGAQGGSSWNPLTSGKTYLEARPYWRQQEVRSYFDRLDQKRTAPISRLSATTRTFQGTLQRGAISGRATQRTGGGLTVQPSITLSILSSPSTFPWARRKDSGSACLPLISGPPIPRHGMTSPRRTTAKLSSKELPHGQGQHSADSGVCVPIPRDGSTTRQPSTTRQSTG